VTSGLSHFESSVMYVRAGRHPHQLQVQAIRDISSAKPLKQTLNNIFYPEKWIMTRHSEGQE
jgi:hypothetical protein